MKEKSTEYEALKNNALEQFRRGKHLLGKGAAFQPLLKEFLESALQAKLNTHLDDEARTKGNRRIGSSTKLVKSAEGSFELETPRDRLGDFEQEIIRKIQL